MEELSEKLKSTVLTIDGERVLTFRRQHWIILWPQGVITFSLAFLFLILWVMSLMFGLISFVSLLIAFLITAIVVVLYDYKAYLDWRRNIFIITDKKIVTVEIDNSKVSHTREVILEPVKETGIEVMFSGILGRYLNFGNITVTFDTSSRIEPITFEKLPDPEGFKEALEEAKYER